MWNVDKEYFFRGPEYYGFMTNSIHNHFCSLAINASHFLIANYEIFVIDEALSLGDCMSINFKTWNYAKLSNRLPRADEVEPWVNCQGMVNQDKTGAPIAWIHLQKFVNLRWQSVLMSYNLDEGLKSQWTIHYTISSDVYVGNFF